MVGVAVLRGLADQGSDVVVFNNSGKHHCTGEGAVAYYHINFAAKAIGIIGLRGVLVSIPMNNAAGRLRSVNAVVISPRTDEFKVFITAPPVALVAEIGLCIKIIYHDIANL